MHTLEDTFTWFELNPKQYWVNGELRGLMSAILEDDGITYIFSTARHEDDSFTYEMLKDIITLYKERVICLIVDTESKQKLIRRALDRYEFTHEYRDGVMYSTGGLQWVDQYKK